MSAFQRNEDEVTRRAAARKAGDFKICDGLEHSYLSRPWPVNVCARYNLLGPSIEVDRFDDESNSLLEPQRHQGCQLQEPPSAPRTVGPQENRSESLRMRDMRRLG